MSARSFGVMGFNLFSNMVEGGGSIDGKSEPAGGIEDSIFSIFITKKLKNLSQSAEVVETASGARFTKL